MGKTLALGIALISLGSLCGQTAAGYVVATVGDVRTTPSRDNGESGMKDDVFYIKFNATLRNTSHHAFLFSGEPLVGVKSEILLVSGEWKSMGMPDQFYTKEPNYPQCTKLRPGKTFTFPDVSDMVVVGRDRPANRTVSVRFYYQNVCMNGSSRHSTYVVTEPIQVHP